MALISTPALPSTSSREIRVFISSTFKDMQVERDYLLTQVFPRLRAMCANRQVMLTEIDLRWGVNEEESKNGMAIEVCLDEIDRCRIHPPFFIGFLGERYGWVPSDHDLVEYWKTRKDSPYAERIQKALSTDISVTELEMQYAFLDNPTAADHARVFLRSPALTDEIYAKQERPPKTDFYDQAGGKLEQFKEKLRGHQPPIMGIDGYQSIEEFGDAVEKFLHRHIDAAFPENVIPTPQQRRDNAHFYYAASRRQAYVPLPALRDDSLTILQQALEGKAPPCIVLHGESGLGKSAFIADLQTWLPEQLPCWIHAHYVGADGDRTLDGWIDRLLLALQSTGHTTAFQKEHMDCPRITEDDKKRWQPLVDALCFVQKGLGKPLVLLLDAADQFREGNVWKDLPPFWPLPSQVILLVSTTPEAAPGSLHWQQLTMRPLDVAQRREAIQVFLRQYRKKLDERIMEQIVTAPASANPLYLRLLLEELRVHALYDTVPMLVQRLLQADNSSKMFLDTLDALDKDYKHPSQIGQTVLGIATLAATLLAVSRRGLGHIDLAKILATPDDPQDPADGTPRVPDRILSALLARLEPFCLQEDGRLGLMHNTMTETLGKSEWSETVRIHMLEYFKNPRNSSEWIEKIYQLSSLSLQSDNNLETFGEELSKDFRSIDVCATILSQDKLTFDNVCMVLCYWWIKSSEKHDNLDWRHEDLDGSINIWIKNLSDSVYYNQLQGKIITLVAVCYTFSETLSKELWYKSFDDVQDDFQKLSGVKPCFDNVAIELTKKLITSQPLDPVSAAAVAGLYAYSSSLDPFEYEDFESLDGPVYSSEKLLMLSAAGYADGIFAIQACVEIAEYYLGSISKTISWCYFNLGPDLKPEDLDMNSDGYARDRRFLLLYSLRAYKSISQIDDEYFVKLRESIAGISSEIMVGAGINKNQLQDSFLQELRIRLYKTLVELPLKDLSGSGIDSISLYNYLINYYHQNEMVELEADAREGLSATLSKIQTEQMLIVEDLRMHAFKVNGSGDIFESRSLELEKASAQMDMKSVKKVTNEIIELIRFACTNNIGKSDDGSYKWDYGAGHAVTSILREMHKLNDEDSENVYKSLINILWLPLLGRRTIAADLTTITPHPIKKKSGLNNSDPQCALVAMLAEATHGYGLWMRSKGHISCAEEYLNTAKDLADQLERTDISYYAGLSFVSYTD